MSLENLTKENILNQLEKIHNIDIPDNLSATRIRM